ncbi:hypothetical protein IQ06DRAFT_55948 [Phaeosphaeriaceae sp. SRC1lsM3a]|nr:hypothetical protein IQ06DRAFT_55948 [Stagonospora sp. SRC1lsM3a]
MSKRLQVALRDLEQSPRRVPSAVHVLGPRVGACGTKPQSWGAQRWLLKISEDLVAINISVARGLVLPVHSTISRAMIGKCLARIHQCERL